jgi:hypothetical protein
MLTDVGGLGHKNLGGVQIGRSNRKGLTYSSAPRCLGKDAAIVHDE